MNTVTTFEARCWGGPLDGQWFASETRELRTARHKPIRWDEPSEPTAESTVGYWVDRYTFERVIAHDWEFVAWVIEGPTERREAVMQTIVDGLNFVWAWCRAVMSAP